jgi:hypothetical protein
MPVQGTRIGRVDPSMRRHGEPDRPVPFILTREALPRDGKERRVEAESVDIGRGTS